MVGDELAIPLDPALPLGDAHQRGPARHVVAIEHAPELALDGLQPERETFGDLGVTEALGHERQDLGLARRRRTKRRADGSADAVREGGASGGDRSHGR